MRLVIYGPGSTDRASSANAYWTHEPVKTARTSVSPNTQHRHLSRTSSGEIRPQSSENNPHTVSLNEQSGNNHSIAMLAAAAAWEKSVAGGPPRAYHRLSPPGLYHIAAGTLSHPEFITRHRSVPHRSGRHLPLCPGVVRHFTGLWAVFSGHSVRPHGGETEKKEGKEKREGEKEDRRVISKSRSGRGRSQYS